MDERADLLAILHERGVMKIHGYPVDGQSLATLQETERATRLPDPPAPAEPEREPGALRWWHWALALVAVGVSLVVGMALQGVGL